MKNLFDISSITRMYSLNNQIKALTKERDAIKKPIETYMKENGVDEKTVGQYHFSVTTYNTTSIDVDMLRERFPEVYDAVATEKTVKRFNM